MTREEAIQRFKGIINSMSISVAQSKFYPSKAELNELCDMAIEALSSEQYKKGFEDAKRAFLIEYARESENMRKRNAQLEVMLNAQKAISSADRPTVDCTEFMEWLKAEVLNEENWELNAVANGEIICRKFKKLGWLDVEDGFYVDARPTGEWIKSNLLPNGWNCDNCGSPIMTDDISEMLYCPNCGCEMKGGDTE